MQNANLKKKKKTVSKNIHINKKLILGKNSKAQSMNAKTKKKES